MSKKGAIYVLPQKGNGLTLAYARPDIYKRLKAGEMNLDLLEQLKLWDIGGSLILDLENWKHGYNGIIL